MNCKPLDNATNSSSGTAMFQVRIAGRLLVWSHISLAWICHYSFAQSKWNNIGNLLPFLYFLEICGCKITKWNNIGNLLLSFLYFLEKNCGCKISLITIYYYFCNVGTILDVRFATWYGFPERMGMAQLESSRYVMPLLLRIRVFSNFHGG